MLMLNMKRKIFVKYFNTFFLYYDYMSRIAGFDR